VIDWEIINIIGRHLTRSTPRWVAKVKRQAEYRELFRYQLDPQMVDEIRVAVNGN
jgi:hypothetical protein